MVSVGLLLSYRGGGWMGRILEPPTGPFGPPTASSVLTQHSCNSRCTRGEVSYVELIDPEGPLWAPGTQREEDRR